MLRRQILAGLLLMAACLARADEPSGREILDRVENLLWAKTLQGRYEMSIVTPRWQRTTWSRKAGILDDYTHKVVATSPVGGEPAWQVEATPKPDAAVVWGRVLYRVRQGDSMPLKQEYFNERNELVRVLAFSDVHSGWPARSHALGDEAHRQAGQRDHHHPEGRGVQPAHRR